MYVHVNKNIQNSERIKSSAVKTMFSMLCDNSHKSNLIVWPTEAATVVATVEKQVETELRFEAGAGCGQGEDFHKTK